MPDPGSPLAQAFHLLLGDAPAERAERALKTAIKVLVDSPRTRLGNRSPNIGAADQERWSELKPRLRQHIAASKTGMSSVAREIELPVSTIQRALSPAGPVPGRGIIALLARWLDQQHIDASPKPAQTGNGGIGSQRVPSPGEGSLMATPSHASHARVGPLPAARLDQAEAGKLLLYLEVTPERRIRDELQMTAELARAAATGAEVPPEAVARINAFLAA